jgi:hypothetical protein
VSNFEQMTFWRITRFDVRWSINAPCIGMIPQPGIPMQGISLSVAYSKLRGRRPVFPDTRRLSRPVVGGEMADKSQFSIVTYERRPGHWRAAVTPFAQSGLFIRGRMTSSIVTDDDSESETDAMLAAEKLIKSL